jgi:hypothetical protein
MEGGDGEVSVEFIGNKELARIERLATGELGAWRG